MTFSYDPTLIADGGLNQARFDLGDVLVNEPEKSCYLSDQEILAAIESSKTLKRAELKLLSSLLHRFSFEVDTEIGEASWKLSDRIAAWEKLYRRLKGEIDSEDAAGAFGLTGKKFRPPIFTVAQHDWR